MSAIMMRLSICELYAGIYEGAAKSITNSEPFRDTLLSALPQFHASVIVFSIKAEKYFNAICKMAILIVYLQNLNDGGDTADKP